MAEPASDTIELPEITVSNSAPSPDGDLSGSYMGHAEQMSANAEIAAFRERMRARQSGKPDAAAPSGPAIPATQNVDAKGILKTVAGGAGRAAADIGGGIMEGAPALAGGITDAFRNAASGLNDVGSWLNTNVADLKVDVPSTGSDTLDAILKPFLNPLETAASLGKLPEQKTVTGNVIREGARFLTGFVPALGAMRGAGVAEVPAIIAAGAASDFATDDPNAGGVANLVQTVPALKNPVSEYLATDPNSPEALNRLRHAIEGAGFGAMSEGVLRGIRALAQSRKAVATADQAQRAIGDAAERSTQWLGDPAAASVIVVQGPAAKQSAARIASAVRATETGVPDDVAARGIEQSAKRSAAPPAKTNAPEVYVNFARINAPEDVQTTIRDMANAFKGEIDEARRGVQTRAMTEDLASNLNMSVEDLLARRQGQPLNAEEALAARRLWATSAEKLLQSAQLAAGGGDAELYNFRRMMAIHHAIQSEVIAARTETARALQSWSIPAGSGGQEKARAIQQMLDVTGGAEVSRELAARVATLAGQGVAPGALAEMVKRGWMATTMDMVKESYTLGLLWSPSTHLANVASNLIVAFGQVYERAVARGIGDVLGSAVDNRVVDGEALAMTYGMISSFKDAFRLGARAMRLDQVDTVVSKVDARANAISSQAVAQARGLTTVEAQAFAETPMGRGIDFIGTATRIPGNVLSAEDEFFKTIAFRGEVHAQSLRMASQEGRSGPDLWRRMAEIANDPPESIRLAAADAALYSTFQNKTGWFGEAMMSLRSSGTLNPTFLVLPFIKTPTNIMRYAFERTPLAPLVGQWRADIAAGGARRDLALARMATGTMIMSVAMDYAASGLITGAGPADPGKKEALLRTGWQPNSIAIDGKYYSYNRADPVGMLLGFAATAAEKLKEKDHAPEDFDTWEEITAAAIGVVSASVVNKSYFQGVSNVMSAVQGAEKGSVAAARLIDRTTGSLVPFSSASNTLRRFIDPVTREVNSPWDAIESRIAGLAASLPPSRNVWGEERKPQDIYGRVFDAVSPAAVTATRDSPADAEIARLGMSLKRIEKKGQFGKADVDFRQFPHVYDEYVRLSGNELKHPAWGLGAKDLIDAVVSGKHPLSDVYRLYSDGEFGGKAGFIKNTVDDFRKLAQQQIMAEPQRWPEFAAMVRDHSATRALKRAPLDPAVTGGPLPAGTFQP